MESIKESSAGAEAAPASGRESKFLTARSPARRDTGRAMPLLRTMWQRQRLEPQELISVAEDRVVPMRMISVGWNAVETVAHAAMVYSRYEGNITHAKAFQSEGEALEAVGLGE